MLFQFKIKLRGISKPPIWRQVSVPSDITFARFSDVIQIVFGWNGYHLWQFTPQGYGSKPIIKIGRSDDWSEPDLEAKTTALKEYFKEVGDKLVYIYDFGDDWFHDIVLEAIIESDSQKYTLIKAKGATPPEDCGGVWGFEHFKQVMAEARGKEYKELCKWMELDPKTEYWEPKYTGLKDGEEIVIDENRETVYDW